MLQQPKVSSICRELDNDAKALKEDIKCLLLAIGFITLLFFMPFGQ